MANEIYHRSNWGNAVNDIAWGDTYEKFDATNEMFVRSDNYENSNETDKLMAAINPKPSILLTPTAYDNGSLHSVKPVKTFGSELVTNGDFATDSDWVVGAGWTIENGKANIDTSGGTGSFNQVSKLTVGKKYRLSLSAAMTAGRVKFQSDAAGVFIFSTDVSNHVFIASSTDVSFRRFDTTTSGYIDNVSVKEVTEADFDFTRGTTATRVNEKGLIEDVTDTNLPRIDYTDGTGSLLLEPQSTNLYDYSQDFSQVYWNKTNATVSTSTITDPAGGQNSFKLVPDSGTGGNRSLGRNFTGLSGLHTQTVFAKKGEYNYIILRTRNAPQTGVMFDLENGTFNVNLTSAAFDSAKIEDYGNGWFRCSMTLDPSQMTVSGQIFTSFSVGITGSETNNFDGDGTSGIYIFGAQFEELSFPTSYIPTSGSTVTRNADVCNNSGSSDLINSTEGVLYCEIAALADDLTFRQISISDGTNDNRVRINYTSTSQQIQSRVVVSGVNQASINKSSFTDITDLTKIALSYKQNEVKFYINGELIGTDTSATMPPADTFNVLNFDSGSGTGDFYGKVKSVAVYKEALTDEELTALTT